MEKKKTEGILLSASTYLGKQKILKIFTLNHGLISLFAKKTTLAQLYSPFLIGEWIYEQKITTDLHRLQDASLINDLSDLRQNYKVLIYAGKMAQNLLQSQLPEKESPLLYTLTVKYFEKLSTFAKPENLAASFVLKILLHDGMLNLQDTCNTCASIATNLDLGESVCNHHRTPHSTTFSLEEWQSLYVLAFSRRFEDLEKVNLTEVLEEKIRNIYRK